MIIIGITGTIASGKGATVACLKEKGFEHYSARDFLFEEITKRGLSLNRDTTAMVANDLRAKHGSGYIIESLFNRAAKSGKNAVIESVRSLGEVAFLKQQEHFFLIAVDAEPKIRYNRAVARGSELDHVTFEVFSAQENRELESTDINKQNLRGCIAQADFTILNNGTLDDLQNEVEKILLKIMPE
ncbi:MAG: hypothetical protein RIT04_85 [Candidatus Parcubacteria bacterium]|jgi:dephospho-CoA kinase